MFRLFKQNLKPFAGFIAIACICTLVQVYSELKLPDLMSDIINTGVVQGDVDYILNIGLKMLGWAFLSMGAVIIVSYFASHTAMGFGRDIRARVFCKVEGFSLHEFDGIGTSSLITRTTNDVQQIERLLQMGLTIALMSPFMFIGAAFMSFKKSADLSLIIFALIPVILVVVGIVVKFGLPLLRSLQARIDRLNLVVRENLTGIRVIRAYNKEAVEQKRFASANSDLAETNVGVYRIMGVLMPAITLVLNAAIVLLLWFGAKDIDAGNLMVGDLMAVIQYATQVLISVMMFSMIFAIMPRAMAAAERINEVLTIEPGITDEANPLTVEGDARGVIEFRNVAFSFSGAENPSLENISFKLSPGETTAIIGPTGSGKSTLINLMLRFYDPSGGSILIDGVDISKMRQKDLRDRIGFVPQKATLFTGTIAENIRYGNIDATFDEVVAAAKIAQADGFIREKEGGYDSLVTQGGGNLSGGQRQRLAIARALVRDAEMYIFDDSFSALDFKTDAAVRAKLHEATASATVVIVAQRVSVAMDADRVIVLDDGHIVGIGTHSELLESCETYRDIAASQLDEEEIATSIKSASTKGGSDAR